MEKALDMVAMPGASSSGGRGTEMSMWSLCHPKPVSVSRNALNPKGFRGRRSVQPRLNVKCFGQERKAVEMDQAPLKRSDVIQLLALAVKTLQEPQNHRRLRELLRNSRPSTIQAHTAELAEMPSLAQRSWPTPPSTAVSASASRHQSADYTFSPPPPVTWGGEQSSSMDHNQWISPTLPFSSSASIEIPVHSETAEVTTSSKAAPEACTPESGESYGGVGRISSSSSLSTMRRLKTLDVHSYVHNALREAHWRSWLQSRQIED